ncbi:hypothetical protein [Tsukamurella paurometabola]|nr:hypothetical protein [Tsukamurella paurometabola]UEA84142.1 hypothetical protein LK411_04710 [Tsukamurella paurometabola]
MTGREMPTPPPFDPNDYRKRVLAAVARRGGPDHTDAFELYDLPLDAAGLSDADVATRLDEVWGFWQRQRDHPKYRTLVARLVAEHERRSAPLRSAPSRVAEAARVRAERAERDAARYEILDTAIERLVERHGGVPAEKVPGLEEIGALGGLTAAEVAARLRRHRVLEGADAPSPAPAPGGLTPQRRAQIRALLAEWGELCGEPVPTLFALLGLGITDAHDVVELRDRAELLHRRAREMPPGRGRAVLDELGVHVREVLTVGGPLADAYARAVVEDATEALRPKVRAAILIEDRLLGPDHEYLAGEGEEHGLDRATAERILAELAAEYGGGVGHAPPGPASSPGTARPAPPPTTGSRAWEAPLKAARAALRRGRPAEAARLAAEAGALDDGTAGAQVRTVADEARRVLDEAAALWREVAGARAAGEYADAARVLAQLQRRALDAPPPPGQPTLQDAIDEARRAQAGPGAAPAPRGATATPPPIARAADSAPTPPAAVPAPPTAVAAHPVDGAVLVTWSSPHPVADYKVSRRRPDGGWSVVGRTRETRLEDGGAPRRAVPVYAVVAVVDGVPSSEARSDAHPAPAPAARASSTPATPPPAASGPAPAPAIPAPGVDFPAITNVAFTGGRLTFDWPPEVTEVYVSSRVAGPPRSPVDPTARSWKVTNTRYQIDGGAVLPADLPRPAHLAVAACRRGPDGALLLAPDFAPTAHLRLD